MILLALCASLLYVGVNCFGINPHNLEFVNGQVISSSFKQCTGGPSSDATPNLNPVYTQDELVYVKFCQNGKLYTAGSDTNTSFHILKVSGTAYDAGFAHGSCLKDEVVTFQSQFWDYLATSLASSWDVSPAIANDTIKTVIDAQIELDYEFIPKYWFEELQGLSDASGVPFNDLLRFHVSSELTGFHCSMIGAWGNAVLNNNDNNKLLQLRALDYDTTCPQKNYPVITVYSIENSNVFATIGAASFIGSITGISSEYISICEIGVSCPDSSFYTNNNNNTNGGNSSNSGDNGGILGPAGYPFVFMLRDILQFDDSLSEGTKRIVNNNRTVDLILGVGDGKIVSTGSDGSGDTTQVPFHGFQYSKDVCNVFNDTNLEPYNETWHPRIENIVYWGMDWWIEDYDEVIATQLLSFYGNITANVIYEQVTAIAQTGNFHIAIYDYANERLLVSFHSKNYDESKVKSGDIEESEQDKAYNRQFTALPFDILFAD